VRNTSADVEDRAARRSARRVEFLFDPVEVAQALDGLPGLASKLGDPHCEGEQASNLPGARKSARELFRVLGNTHYAHLAELLGALDACIGAGFTQPTLLRSRGRRPFREAIAELRTAEHFRLGENQISGFDDGKDGVSVPDMLVEGTGVTAVVEVFCPQAWPGLADYTQMITDRVKNLDRGVDFGFRIEHEQLEQFGPGMPLLPLHPADVSDRLDEPTRLEATGALINGVEAALDNHVPPRARTELAAINLATTVELSRVTTASTPVPARAGVISGPAFGGYRPEAMFADVVKRVIGKLEKRQAVGVSPDAVPVLVVEMSQSQLTSELRHTQYYRPGFEKTLNTRLTDLRGYGVVAFCEAVGWARRLRLHFLVAEQEIVDDATARCLFP
jgi:hypothetical protein